MQKQEGDFVVSDWADGYSEVKETIEKSKIKHYENALKSIGYTLEFLGTEIPPRPDSEYGDQVLVRTYSRLTRELR